MNKDINNLLTLLEVTMINEEKSEYLEVSYQNGFVYILSSKEDYKNYTITERIKGILELLKFEHNDILLQHPVIVECFDSSELDGLFLMYSKKEYIK